MFDNIGRKIKGYAKIVFAIGVIVGCILAFVQLFALFELDEGFWGLCVFLFTIAISVLISFISAMFIYGFGELVENSERIRRNTEETYNITYELYSHEYDKDKKSSSSHTTPINHGTIPATRRGTSVDGWICGKCDMRNASSAMYCKSCGSNRPDSAGPRTPIKHETPINHGTIPATSGGTGSDGWTCKSCGTKNNTSAVYCKSCGAGR